MPCVSDFYLLYELKERSVPEFVQLAKFVVVMYLRKMSCLIVIGYLLCCLHLSR